MRIHHDDTPPASAFSMTLIAGAGDIDLLGHVNNVRWVQWINDLATTHSSSVGLDFDTYTALGYLWIIRKHEVEYLRQALEGDVVTGVTWVQDQRGVSSNRASRFFDGAGQLLVRATTTWVLCDVETRRPRRIPPDLMGRYGFKPAE
ncbi:MAG: thioesterase family protein [Pseudomonadota bacterium]